MTDTLTNTLISYAQNREDVILQAILRGVKRGFYVDVGANHPVTESVTKHFYNHGWRGINIEPLANLHALLEADRPRDINLMVGVSDKKGELSFRYYEHGDGLSTFSTEMQTMYEKGGYAVVAKYKEYKVAVTTLAEIFKQHQVSTIDFLKIDIEGYEYEALAGNDWKKYRPRVICIEANHIIRDWHGILKHAGYRLVFFDGLNEYFVRHEDKKLADEFSYADHILLADPFIKWETQNEFVDIERKSRLRAHKLRQAEAELDACRQEAMAAPAQSKKGMKGRAISLAKKLDRKIEGRLRAVHITPVNNLQSALSKVSSIALAGEIKRSLADALDKAYDNPRQHAAHYYHKTRRFIAKRRRS